METDREAFVYRTTSDAAGGAVTVRRDGPRL